MFSKTVQPDALIRVLLDADSPDRDDAALYLDLHSLWHFALLLPLPCPTRSAEPLRTRSTAHQNNNLETAAKYGLDDLLEMTQKAKNLCRLLTDQMKESKQYERFQTLRRSDFVGSAAFRM